MTKAASISELGAEIVEDFSLFDDWMERYEHLIELGKTLQPLHDDFKNDTYRIRGCQSQVWLVAERGEGAVRFKADSDALITKGLVALLVGVLDDQPPEEVASADLSFLDQIGMREHLSPNRRNGLDAMVKRMREYAASFAEETQETIPSGMSETAPSADLLEENIVEMIKTVYDPEIPVNVYDLGLIYGIEILPDQSVQIRMTLTAPNCPAAGWLPGQVEQRVRTMDGVSDARVDLTFDPPYHPDMMSDEAKLELGFL